MKGDHVSVARRSFQSTKTNAWEATNDAKAQATKAGLRIRKAGLRIRTVAKVSGKPGDWTVELAIDEGA